MVGDPGIEPGVRLREGVTVPCHTLRPVAHLKLRRLALARERLRLRKTHVNPKIKIDWFKLSLAVSSVYNAIMPADLGSLLIQPDLKFCAFILQLGG